MDVETKMQETVSLLHGHGTHQLMDRAREVVNDSDAEPELRQRARELLDTWTTEIVRAAESGDDAPMFLTEAEAQAATPEEKRLAEIADQELARCGERFRAALEKLVANDQKEMKR